MQKVNLSNVDRKKKCCLEHKNQNMAMICYGQE